MLDNLSNLIDSTSLSRDWIKYTEAKPTKVALWIIHKQLKVCAIYWEGNEGGVWDDENAVSMTNIILDLK